MNDNQLKKDRDFDDAQFRASLPRRGFDPDFLESTYDPTDEESKKFWKHLENYFKSPLSTQCVQRHSRECDGRGAYSDYVELLGSVLLGRGGHAVHNPGNIRFRNLVSAWCDQGGSHDASDFVREHTDLRFKMKTEKEKWWRDAEENEIHDTVRKRINQEWENRRRERTGNAHAEPNENVPERGAVRGGDEDHETMDSSSNADDSLDSSNEFQNSVEDSNMDDASNSEVSGGDGSNNSSGDGNESAGAASAGNNSGEDPLDFDQDNTGSSNADDSLDSSNEFHSSVEDSNSMDDASNSEVSGGDGSNNSSGDGNESTAAASAGNNSGEDASDFEGDLDYELLGESPVVTTADILRS